jgi:hypothetical protein
LKIKYGKDGFLELPRTTFVVAPKNLLIFGEKRQSYPARGFDPGPG